MSSSRNINMLHDYLATKQQTLPESTPEEVNKFLLKIHHKFLKELKGIKNANNDDQFRKLLNCCCIYIDVIFNYLTEYSFTDVNLKNMLKLLDVFMYVFNLNNPRIDLVETLYKILDVITFYNGPVWCGREVIYTLNKCYTNADSKLCRQFIEKNTFVLYKLIDLLSSCGDFDFQFEIIKLIHNVCSRKTIETEVKNFFPENKEFCEKFLAITECKLDQDIRDFLCALNKPIERVFSFQCKIISLDNIRLSEMNNWIDFNLKSDTVSFYCSKNLFLNLPSSSSTTGENGDFDALFLPVEHVDFITYDEGELKHRSEKYVYVRFEINRPLLTRNSNCGNKYEVKMLHLVMFKSSDSEMLIYHVLPLMFNEKMMNANVENDLLKSSGISSMVTNGEITSSKSCRSSISDCAKKIQEHLAASPSDKNISSSSLILEEIIDLTESDSETICTEYDGLIPQRNKDVNENSGCVSSNTLEFHTALSLDDLDKNLQPILTVLPKKSEKSGTVRIVRNRSLSSVDFKSADPCAKRIVCHSWHINVTSEIVDLTSDDEEFAVTCTSQGSSKEFSRMPVMPNTEKSEYNTALSEVPLSQLSNKKNVCTTSPKEVKKQTSKNSDKENYKVVSCGSDFGEHLESTKKDRDLLLSLTAPMDFNSCAMNDTINLSQTNKKRSLRKDKPNENEKLTVEKIATKDTNSNESKIKIVSNIIISNGNKSVEIGTESTDGVNSVQKKNTETNFGEELMVLSEESGAADKKKVVTNTDSSEIVRLCVKEYGSLNSWFEYIVSSNSVCDNDSQINEEVKQSSQIEQKKENIEENSEGVSNGGISPMIQSFKQCKVVLERLSPKKYQTKNEELTFENYPKKIAQNETANLILQSIKPCEVILERLPPLEMNNEKCTNKVVENEVAFDDKNSANEINANTNNELEEEHADNIFDDCTCKTQLLTGSIKTPSEPPEKSTLEEILEEQTQNEALITDENTGGQSNEQNSIPASVFSQDTVIIMRSQSQPLESSDGATNNEQQLNSAECLEDVIKKMEIVGIGSPKKCAESERSLNVSESAIVKSPLTVVDVVKVTEKIDGELSKELNKLNEVVEDNENSIKDKIDYNETNALVAVEENKLMDVINDIQDNKTSCVEENKPVIKNDLELNEKNYEIEQNEDETTIGVTNETKMQVQENFDGMNVSKDNIQDNETSYGQESEPIIKNDLQELNEKNSEVQQNEETPVDVPVPMNEMELQEKLTQIHLEDVEIDVLANNVVENINHILNETNETEVQENFDKITLGNDEQKAPKENTEKSEPVEAPFAEKHPQENSPIDVFTKPAIPKIKKTEQNYDTDKSKFFENGKLQLLLETFEKNTKTKDSNETDVVENTSGVNISVEKNQKDTTQPNKLNLSTKYTSVSEQSNNSSELELLNILNNIPVQMKTNEKNPVRKARKRKLYDKDDESHLQYSVNDTDKSTPFISPIKKTKKRPANFVKSDHSELCFERTKIKKISGLTTTPLFEQLTKMMQMDKTVVQGRRNSRKRTKKSDVETNTQKKSSGDVKVHEKPTRNSKKIKIIENILINGPSKQNETVQNEFVFYQKVFADKTKYNQIECDTNSFDNTNNFSNDQKKSDDIQITVSAKFIQTVITSLKDITEACISELNGSHKGMESEFRALCRAYDALISD